MNLKRRHNLIVNRSSVDESDSDDSKDDSDQSKEKDDNQNIDEGKSRLRKEEAKRRVREMARKILEPSEPTDDDDLITHRFSAFSSNAESSRPSRATPSSKNVKPPGKRTSKRARVTFDMSENELSFSSSSSNDDDDDDYEENKRQSKVSGGSKKSRRKSPPAATKKAAASPVKEELSEYERLRLKNIEERKRIFETLHLNDTKKRLSDAFDGVGGSHKKLTPSRRGLAAPNKKKSDPLPLRKSSRLLKLDADTSLQLPEKEPTVYPVLESDDRPPKPFR